MYASLFLLFLIILLWTIIYREGMEGAPSACESINAQNQVDLQNLSTKVDTALQLSETVKKLESTLQENTTRIDTIINTQLTALVSGKR